MSENHELKRAVGPIQLTLYGVGSMLGAGIYGLVGRAAGVMGSAVWMAFGVAMIAALLTGISYASIASRYPKAAGAAYTAQRAYRKAWLSYLVGLTVVCSGLASIATQSKVVAGNLLQLFGVAPADHSAVLISLMAIGFIMIVAGIVYRGISESLFANAVCTIVEAAGLVFVIVVGMRFWGDASLLDTPVDADGGQSAITAGLLLQGAVLTFFSFLGFEDMLNVSEEVKAPNRTMPIAVISAMIIVSVVYMAVSITAVSVVPWQELKEAPAPLREVVARAAPWFPAVGFTLITIFAVANTALINYIMGSRLLYGMARQCLLPSVLGKVHGKRKTPHYAILAILAVVILLQVVGKTVDDLAAATVLLLLFVFVLVNGALIVLKLREGNHPGCFNAPIIIPALAIVICLAMMVARVVNLDQLFGAGVIELGPLRAPAIAGGLVVLVLMLYAVTGLIAGKERAAKIEAYWRGEEDGPAKV